MEKKLREGKLDREQVLLKINNTDKSEWWDNLVSI